jgi:predicted  nucleic acid-binding Zn-ribbon protein
MTARMMTPLLLIAFASALQVKEQTSVNPIRKIIVMMENMQKEIEAEGEKEKALFDKFMCFCDNGAGDLLKTASDADAQNKAATAQLEQDSSEKAQLESDIKTHTSDLETATKDLEEATTIREKEKAEFDSTIGTKKSSEAALGKAIPAIEKGMGGAAFLQTFGKHVVNQIKKALRNSGAITDTDRSTIQNFLQSGATGAGSGEILGMLKAMKDELSRDVASLEKNEASAVDGFGSMRASKEKEIEFADESIESKKERIGALAVSVVELKNVIEDSATEAEDAKKFAATLEKQCKEKKAEWDARCKARADEIAAIGEAIGILSDDDALDVFKKSLPASALIQGDGQAYGYHHHRNMFTGEMSLLQSRAAPAGGVHKALAIVSGLNKQARPMGIMLYTLKSKLREASRGAVDFSAIFKMIDEMIEVLTKENKDDAAQKDFCVAELDKTEREKESVDDKMAQITATLEETGGEIEELEASIKELQDGVAALDKDVAEATAQRKKEHEDYGVNLQMNELAIEIIGKAKNRLQKFYNPSLYKAPPKKEMTMEEKLIAQGGSALMQTEAEFDASFVQIRSHSQVAPPEAPETFSGDAPKKNEKSGGVMALMDMIIGELKTTVTEAKMTEKYAQKDYVDLMNDAQEKRAADSKTMVDETSMKAELEAALTEAKENQMLTMEQQGNVMKTISELHGTCDFILKNFELRLNARTAEIEGLKTAKAVLAGANFS